MQDVADQSAAPTPIGADLCAIFVSLELSRSTWLATSLSSGRGEKMSKHSVSAGDIAALLARFSELRRKACTRRHPDLFPSSGSIAPYRRTFCFYGFCFGHRRHRMLALPVLAGSAAYALGETLHWRVGLAQRPGRAPAVYVTIEAATLVGATLNFTPLDPVKALMH